MLESFTSQTFKSLQGALFTVEQGNDRMELKLAEVTELGYSMGAEARREPFSLTFLGPLDRVWEQRIYRVTQDAIGSFDLFLVPIGVQGADMAYEAVFT